MDESSSAGPARLAEVIDEFLTAIRKGTETSAFDVFTEMDLTLTQLRTVFLLAEADADLSINEIADRVHTSVATAGRTVDRLTRLELVDRREDPEDRRSKLVSLTSEGKKLTDIQIEGVRRRIRSFSDALPADVADRLRSAMLAALDATPSRLRGGSARGSRREGGS